MWIHPKLSRKFKQDKTQQYVVYYHIETSNYETDSLIINGGLEVETYTNNNKKYQKIREKRIKQYLVTRNNFILHRLTNN